MGLYKRFDDGVMYTVNKGVKAWNWTTGKTKTDLANGMLSVAPIVGVIGNIVDDDVNRGVMFALITSPIYFVYSHIFQKRNIKQEKEELKALEDGLKLPEERYNSSNKIWGTIFELSGCYLLVKNLTYGRKDHSFMDESSVILGTGQLITGASHYVMRAENLPPRKNVLSRAVDKIKEKLAQKELKPATAPAYGLERLL